MVLVTGSSRGIGRSIAEGFLQEGATVVLNARGAEALDRTCGELRERWGGDRVSALRGDVADEAQMGNVVKSVREQFGHLDVLVCNAGGGRSVPPLEEDASEWERLLRANLLSAAIGIKTAAPLLANRAGAIVVISSIAGIEALGAPATYTAAKAALNAYVKSVSGALALQQTRINAICPGNILFDDSVWQRKMREDPQGTTAMLERDVPMRRFGTPEEVAAAALFLSSPRASFITGACVVVDGGQTRSW